MKRWPFLAIAIALLAVAICAWPAAREYCVLDRSAFFRGEWWRMFTSQFVHFSPSHLWLDVMVFLGAGGWIERQSRRVFAVLFGLASVAIAGAVLVFSPEFQFYGGLSGVATAMLFFVALQCVENKGTLRAGGIAVVAALLAKLIFEELNPQPLLARFDSSLIRSAPVSHAAGMATALVIWCAIGISRWWAGMNSFSRERPV